jgi:transcriptional regulator with XRE-family HTH domain
MMNHNFNLLKKRREHLGLTVRDVRKITKLSYATVTAVERRNYDPKTSTLKKLAKCYGLDPSLLLKDNLPPDDFHSAVVNGAG